MNWPAQVVGASALERLALPVIRPLTGGFRSVEPYGRKGDHVESDFLSLYRLIYLNSDSNPTLSVTLSKLTGAYGSTAWALLRASWSLARKDALRRMG